MCEGRSDGAGSQIYINSNKKCAYNDRIINGEDVPRAVSHTIRSLPVLFSYSENT